MVHRGRNLGGMLFRVRLPRRVGLVVTGMLCMSSVHFSTASSPPQLLWPPGGHLCFDPRETTVPMPSSLKMIAPRILDPGKEGSFAKYTLMKRLPAVVERILKEGAVKGDEEIKKLGGLSAEIPEVHLKRPVEVCAADLDCQPAEAECFNSEWARWTDQRNGAGWTQALPLISTEMYFYRRILDCTGFFKKGTGYLNDPYEGQKATSLISALESKAFLSTVDQLIAAGRTGSKADTKSLLRKFLLADLWGNQGDLALAPLDDGNAHVARSISQDDSHSNLLQDESQAAIHHIMSSTPGRIDIVLDNSGIELLCDLVLADFLLSHKLATQVHLHVKGEPLFISDSMTKDVVTHISALAHHEDPNIQVLAGSLMTHMELGSLVVRSHMFWTAPRLFWEMPQSLASDLSEARLVIVKGDANYRRLVGDCDWPLSTPLSEVVSPWFPAPLLALRTLKAEIALGISEDVAAAARGKDRDWMVNGKFAQIQFVGRQ